MAEQRRRLVRLAVLEELRASYGIKVKSGSCLAAAAAKQPGAAAAEVRRAVTLRCSRRAPDGRARPRRGAGRLPLRQQGSPRPGSWSPASGEAGWPPNLAPVPLQSRCCSCQPLAGHSAPPPLLGGNVLLPAMGERRVFSPFSSARKCSGWWSGAAVL